MFNIKKSDLAYEKVMRLLNEADEQAPNPNDPMDLNNNMGDPTNDSVTAAQNGISPQQAYEMALKAMDEKIEQTGRKRYQKYRMDGGKGTYSEFKDKMEEKALKEIDKEMKQQFGFIPGKETEKDLLVQIRDLLQGLKQNNDEEQEVTAMQLTGQLPFGGQQQFPPDQGMPLQDQGQAPQEQPPMEQGQDQGVSPQDQNQGMPPQDQGQQAPPEQPMQEGLDRLNEMMYNRKMKELFNYYFG